MAGRCGGGEREARASCLKHTRLGDGWRGYAVWSFGMRGHGRSAGGRFELDAIDDLHCEVIATT